ncbi:Uncharacterized protein APZ42_019627 [Daphnia magna]|uniref:Uncharacterized protein n=1 Tax=Daphnia magna TaxID=35525 RepID=A0A164YAM8_9CRUS|nr:Uncharacterized protein APZ42_019627 [Daphnia magna]
MPPFFFFIVDSSLCLPVCENRAMQKATPFSCENNRSSFATVFFFFPLRYCGSHRRTNLPLPLLTFGENNTSNQSGKLRRF